jgi:hypothetical protein
MRLTAVVVRTVIMHSFFACPVMIAAVFLPGHFLHHAFSTHADTVQEHHSSSQVRPLHK